MNPIFLFVALAAGAQGDPQPPAATGSTPTATDTEAKAKVCTVRPPTGSIMGRRSTCGAVATTGDSISEEQLFRMRQEKQARDSVTLNHGI